MTEPALVRFARWAHKPSGIPNGAVWLLMIGAILNGIATILEWTGQ